jgi:hypothetical protein
MIISVKNGMERYLFPCDCGTNCFLALWVDRDKEFPPNLFIEQEQRGNWRQRIKDAFKLLRHGELTVQEVILTEETVADLKATLDTL